MNDYSVINERNVGNEKYESISLSNVHSKSDTNLIAEQSSEIKNFDEPQGIYSTAVHVIKPVIHKVYSNSAAKKKKKSNIYAKNQTNRRNIRRRFSGGNSVAPEVPKDNHTTNTNKRDLPFVPPVEPSLSQPNENVYRVQSEEIRSETLAESLNVTEFVQTSSAIESAQDSLAAVGERKEGDREFLVQDSEQIFCESGSVGSYLSAESGYVFPDSPLTEPLDSILAEKDLPSFDDFGCPSQRRRYAKTSMSHRSDPGFIGPVVWKMHKNYFHT